MYAILNSLRIGQTKSIIVLSCPARLPRTSPVYASFHDCLANHGHFVHVLYLGARLPRPTAKGTTFAIPSSSTTEKSSSIPPSSLSFSTDLPLDGNYQRIIHCTLPVSRDTKRSRHRRLPDKPSSFSAFVVSSNESIDRNDHRLS